MDIEDGKKDTTSGKAFESSNTSSEAEDDADGGSSVSEAADSLQETTNAQTQTADADPEKLKDRLFLLCFHGENKLLYLKKIVPTVILFVAALMGYPITSKFLFYVIKIYYPATLLLIESIFIAVGLRVIAIWNRKIRLEISNISFEDVRDCFLPALFLNLHNYTLLIIFKNGNLSTFCLIKRFGPCITLIMMICVQSLRSKINPYIVPGVILMVVGGGIGTLGMIPPIGLVAVSARCLFLLTLKSQCLNKSPWIIYYLISLISIVSLLFGILLFDEHNQLYDGFIAHTIEFWWPELWIGVIGFVATLIMSKVSIILISKFMKPLLTDTIDELQITALAIFGMFIFDGVATPYMIAGVTVSSAGAFLYTTLNHTCSRPLPAEEDCEKKKIHSECSSYNSLRVAGASSLSESPPADDNNN